MLRRTLALALAATFAVTATPSPAEAGAKKARKSRKARKTAKKAPAGKAAAKAKAGDRDVAAVHKWLREHIAATTKSGKPSDLATAMLGGLVQLAIPNLVHGHYALAGTGQAMRGGRMPEADVVVVASDIARNFEALGRIFAGFAARPALKGQVGRFFSRLQGLTVHGVTAAKALATYAKSPTQQAAATAFENALERYRGAVRSFLGQLK